MKRLPAVRTLAQILPSGAEGGKEFARIVDILLFYHAQRYGTNLTLFDDSSGDFESLDAFSGGFRRSGKIGYQYKFYPSPLSAEHRREIKKSLEGALSSRKKSRLEKWVLITPEDFVESSGRRDGGDVTWFEKLRKDAGTKVTLEHWGHKALLALFMDTPSLCLLYYPSLVPGGAEAMKTIVEVRKKYNSNLDAKYRRIRFVGMSVYKPETSHDIAMEHVYIPLRLVSEKADDTDGASARTNPAELLSPGGHHVILGDPGSGKSTLLRFLALAGQTRSLQERFGVLADSSRLPILVTLRRYADELKSRRNLSLIDHIVESTQADFSLKGADARFFDHYLESGRALLCFDGLDELPNSAFKETVRDRIVGLLNTYPGNTCIVTSRIVGYEREIRFGERDFAHHKVARLQLPEIEQFISDWYTVREKFKPEREDSIRNLVAIMRDSDHDAIRELARNPLLLTIIALVHRIDAVLPDERVVLYEKCTETLLNTWHTWKFRDINDRTARNKIEQKHRRRLEAVAYWMQCRSVDVERERRAIVPHEEIHQFLTDHIRAEQRRADHGDATDAAERFLEFVQKRAGLLVEVGDRQYSFVHLTFQEYLTSAHIKTISESAGVDGLWANIQARTRVDRWQETIRLLVASLKAEDTREELVRRIVLQCEDDCTLERTTLLLGLMIDSVEQANEREVDIARLALNSMVQANDPVDLGRVVARVRSIARRDSSFLELLMRTAEQAKTATSPTRQSRKTQDRAARTLLSLLALGVEYSTASAAVVAPGGQVDAWAQGFLNGQPVAERTPDVDASLRSMFELGLAYARFAPRQNFMAAYSALVFFALDPELGIRYLVSMLACCLLAEHKGPAWDFAVNVDALWMSELGVERPPLGQRRREFQKGIYRVFDILRSAASVDGEWHAVLDYVRLPERHLEKRIREEPDIHWMASELESVAPIRQSRVWELLTSDPVLADAMARMWVDGLRLHPPSHWLEVVTKRFAPGAGQYARAIGARRSHACLNGRVTKQNQWAAALFLLQDAALDWGGAMDALAAAARESHYVPVVFAGCIRDICCGEKVASAKDRLQELVARRSRETVAALFAFYEPNSRESVRRR